MIRWVLYATKLTGEIEQKFFNSKAEADKWTAAVWCKPDTEYQEVAAAMPFHAG